MPGRQIQIRAIAHAAGYATVAVAIAATALHVRHGDDGISAPVRTASIKNDPLAPALARCQSIGLAAKDDAACKAVWAENRRRFFTYRPADDATSTPTIMQKPTSKPEGR